MQTREGKHMKNKLFGSGSACLLSQKKFKCLLGGTGYMVWWGEREGGWG